MHGPAAAEVEEDEGGTRGMGAEDMEVEGEVEDLKEEEEEVEEGVSHVCAPNEGFPVSTKSSLIAIF